MRLPTQFAFVLLTLVLVGCGGDGLRLERERCGAHDTRAACEADAACVVGGCPDCEGGTDFQGCYAVGQAPEIACPAIACAPSCEEITTEQSCESQPGCHGVYQDPGNCLCAGLGCCIQFARCAADPIACQPPSGGITCKRLQPSCEGDYVLAYSESCYEGCVKRTRCPSL